MPSKQLVEKQNQLVAVQEKLDGIIQQASPEGSAEMDLTLVKKIGEEDISGKSYTTAQIAEEFRKLNQEMEDVGKEVTSLAAVEKAVKDNEAMKVRLTDAQGNQLPHPSGNPDGQPKRIQRIGDAIVSSAAFKQYQETKSPTRGVVKDFGMPELKADFTTSAGWDPEDLRTGRVVLDATRPIAVIDIIPPGQTNSSAVVYMEETTYTPAAAERAESAAYAESTFELTQRTENVRSIGASVPVTDEQLADVAQVRSYLNQRLTFGIRQRLDVQMIKGNGTAPNLSGITDRTGLLTQAKGTDNVPNAIYKAMTKVVATGHAFPSQSCHSSQRLAGCPVAAIHGRDLPLWASFPGRPDHALGSPGDHHKCHHREHAVVGDFTNFCQMVERQGIEVQVGYVDDDFLDGRQTIRAGIRVAFAVYRAAAFATITAI